MDWKTQSLDSAVCGQLNTKHYKLEFASSSQRFYTTQAANDEFDEMLGGDVLVVATSLFSKWDAHRFRL